MESPSTNLKFLRYTDISISEALGNHNHGSRYAIFYDGHVRGVMFNGTSTLASSPSNISLECLGRTPTVQNRRFGYFSL